MAERASLLFMKIVSQTSYAGKQAPLFPESSRLLFMAFTERRAVPAHDVSDSLK